MDAPEATRKALFKASFAVSQIPNWGKRELPPFYEVTSAPSAVPTDLRPQLLHVAAGRSRMRCTSQVTFPLIGPESPSRSRIVSDRNLS